MQSQLELDLDKALQHSDQMTKAVRESEFRKQKALKAARVSGTLDAAQLESDLDKILSGKGAKPKPVAKEAAQPKALPPPPSINDKIKTLQGYASGPAESADQIEARERGKKPVAQVSSVTGKPVAKPFVRPDQPSAIERFTGAASDTLTGFAQFPIELGKVALDSLTGKPAAAGKKLWSLLAEPQLNEYRKAQELTKKKGYKDGRAALADPEILGHWVAAGLPMVGPMAAHAGERIGSGDIAGGLGETAAILAPMGVSVLKGKAAEGVKTVAAELPKELPKLPALDLKTEVPAAETVAAKAPAAKGMVVKSSKKGGITTLDRDTLKVEVNPDRIKQLEKQGETPEEITARLEQAAQHENFHALIEQRDGPTMKAVAKWARANLPRTVGERVAQAAERGDQPFQSDAMEHRFIDENFGSPKKEPKLPPVPSIEPAKPVVEAAKEPWQMTKRAYLDQEVQRSGVGSQDTAAITHKASVMSARALGKAVPPEVSAEYPQEPRKPTRIEQMEAERRESPKAETAPTEAPKGLPPVPKFEMSEAERTASLAAADKFSKDKPPAKPEPSGAGAMRTGYKPPQSEITQLGEATKAAVETAKQAGEKPSQLSPLPRSPLDLKQKITDAAQAAKTGISNAWQQYKAGPARPISSVEAAQLDFQGEVQAHTINANNFGKMVKQAIPDAARRDAIFRYAAANGDATVLQDWASKATDPRAKLGYENALKLNDTEQTIAENFKGFFEPMLQEGLDAGVINSAIEDYVTQIVKKAPKGSRLATMKDQMSANAQASLLNPNFRHGKQRVFPSIFEGEQAGYTYDTDFASAASHYYQSMGKAIESRRLLKSLQDLKASDGRPAVAVSGSGVPVTDTLLVKPDAKVRRGADISDYKPVDHWAFKGWKWIADEGKDVMLQGDLLVHPDFINKLKARFEPSGVRTFSATVAGHEIHPGAALLKAQGFAKGTLFSLSPGFHLVAEGTHGLGHTINPISSLPKLDPSIPTVMEALKGGLQLAGGKGSEMFTEGSSGGGLIDYIPKVGKLNADYRAWLFHDYIPRLKLKTYEHILDRNTSRYGSKLTREQLVSLSADQANAAYGELNYFKLARSKTMQDVFRLAALAPDFLEARARFVGQGLKGYGREQLRALLVLAGTQYVTARILNQIGHDNPEMDAERMFQVKIGDKWWGIRSVPGDMLHLASDWRGFINWRLNPAIVVPPIEALTGTELRTSPKDIGKEWVIKKGKTLPEVGVTAGERMLPIPLQGFTKKDIDLLNSLLQSVGVVQMKQPKQEKKGLPPLPSMKGLKGLR